MLIKWYGQSCFQITCSQGKAEKINIVIDPFGKDIGLKPPSLKADIALVSHQHADHNNLAAIKDNLFAIDKPGEYEIKGIFIGGIPAFHDEKQGKERGGVILYTIEAEDMRICHLADLGQKELLDEQLEALGEVDILMLPTGGVFTIDGIEAQEIVNQIEPKLVIPMHYKIPGLTVKLEPVENFLKAMGQKNIEPLEKLVVKKKDLPEEETKIILLKP